MPPSNSSREEVLRWFRDEFAGSFINDASPDHWPRGKGFFAIALLSLAQVTATAELLGSTTRGDDGREEAKTIDVITFLKARLGRPGAPSGERYRATGGLLYSMLRHGLVHRREPGALSVHLDGGDVSLIWMLSRMRLRDAHLTVETAETSRPDSLPKLEPGQVLLWVDVDLLFDDVVSLLKQIESDAGDSRALSDEIYRNANRLFQPQSLVSKKVEQLVITELANLGIRQPPRRRD